jgi:hypothetical protein
MRLSSFDLGRRFRLEGKSRKTFNTVVYTKLCLLNSDLWRGLQPPPDEPLYVDKEPRTTRVSLWCSRRDAHSSHKAVWRAAVQILLSKTRISKLSHFVFMNIVNNASS